MIPVSDRAILYLLAVVSFVLSYFIQTLFRFKDDMKIYPSIKLFFFLISLCGKKCVLHRGLNIFYTIVTLLTHFKFVSARFIFPTGFENGNHVYQLLSIHSH